MTSNADYNRRYYTEGTEAHRKANLREDARQTEQNLTTLERSYLNGILTNEPFTATNTKIWNEGMWTARQLYTVDPATAKWDGVTAKLALRGELGYAYCEVKVTGRMWRTDPVRRDMTRMTCQVRFVEVDGGSNYGEWVKAEIFSDRRADHAEHLRNTGGDTASRLEIS